MMQQLNKHTNAALKHKILFTNLQIFFTYLTIYIYYIYTDTKHLFQQCLSEMMA